MYFEVAVLVALISCAPAIKAQQGIYLSLRGVYIANNSYVDVDDIGEADAALLCHTNKIDCCRFFREGEWYFPNSSQVQTEAWHYSSGFSEFFYRNRQEQAVRLNRRGNPLERGHFHCVIPDANYVNQILNVNILEIGTVTTSPSVVGTVGEEFSIHCSVDIAPYPLPVNVPTPNFEWFFGPSNSSLPSGVTISPVTVTNNGNTYRSTLQFSPLLSSHAGKYTCRFVGNESLASSTFTTVKCNGNKLQVTGDESSVYIGNKYTLTCAFIDSSVFHTSNNYTYQWKKDGSIMQNLTASNISFSSITFSDAGEYVCEVTVDSILYCGTKTITLEFPAPSFVMITSNPASPIRPNGTDVAIMCSCELSAEVDVQVIVKIQLTDPNGNLLSATTPSLSESTYTSTATVHSFGRNQSGVYTCEAKLISDSPFLTDSGTLSKELRISTNVYLSLGNNAGLENNTFLTFPDIGTKAPHQMVCTSDKMPCCRDPTQYGVWKFPNGSLVNHISEGAMAFHSDRDNFGNVNLYRVHDNVTSPGGQFCCEIEDATNTNQTLCVIIVPSISQDIVASGSPLLGERFTLTCIVSGASITIYKWKRGDQILPETGPILFFAVLSLSDAGRYTCEITFHVWNFSTHHDVFLKIPDPTVHIVSNASNPIRPLGSPVSLVSTVELSPAVDVLVTVTTVWTGPDGFMSTNVANPTPSRATPGTVTHFIMISSLGRSQSGNYTCTVYVSSPSSMIEDSNIISVVRKLTVGVYLSMGGEILPSNRVIFITDIGTSESSGQYVTCTTDKMPCCRYLPQYGDWKFPNGSKIIHIGGGALQFYRNRDNAGNVNLYRVSSDVTSPTGRFCCEVPDATDTNQTLCVDIISPLDVQVRANGTTIAGQSYTLTCNVVNTVSTYPNTLSYRWIKNNGTQTEVGAYSRFISFSTLTISNSGQYTCIVTVSSTSLKQDKEFRSSPFSVDVFIPQPVVRLVSNTPNPILSGSSPTLTCTVELDPTVDVPVDVTTVWSGPDGLTLMSDASPVMKSFTHYTSKLTLNYVESADSGNYSCTVNIRRKIRASVSKEVIIRDGVFQLRLLNADICQPCSKCEKEFDLYNHIVKEALIEAVESRCECHFPKAHLFEATFSCTSSPNLATYRNTLIGTHNFNATQLIGFIQDWVTFGPRINVKGLAVRLDKSCPVAIASLSDPECGEVSQCSCANDPNVAKCVEHLGNEDFTVCINSCI